MISESTLNTQRGGQISEENTNFPDKSIRSISNHGLMSPKTFNNDHSSRIKLLSPKTENIVPSAPPKEHSEIYEKYLNNPITLSENHPWRKVRNRLKIHMLKNKFINGIAKQSLSATNMFDIGNANAEGFLGETDEDED